MTFLIICAVLLTITLPSCVALGTTTAVIPWSDDPAQSMPFTSPPHVRLWFTREETYTGRPDSFTFFVDTGSTGIITRVANLNVLASESRTPGAYLFLTSSNTLYGGFWINRWVWFNKGTTSEVRALVPVLAVEYKCECPYYVVGVSGPTVLATTPLAGPISIMGIGFGRTYNGQPQSTPDKNVLLNVESIGGISTTGTAVGTTYSPGWIIDKDGITLGLTNSNWSPFASRTVSLPAPVPAPVSPRYRWQWGEIPGTYRVAGFTPADCSDLDGCGILIDTGINYASARSQEQLPDDFPRDSTSHQLSRGRSVTVQFGVGGTPAGTQTFTVGPPGSPDRSCSFAPQYVKVSWDSSMSSGFNTGSHMLRKWRMAIDFVAGVVGFAPATPVTGAC
ncbi:hypothetical protein GQ44DRAFT_733234 [Phaeosphaeriaceae sp. PMI808]|nr:hypothetical protein GQ44DRAFT_733234 [Phaeosphaeriaceae sp. PMI808]